MNVMAEAGVYRRTADGGLPGPSEPDATDLARAREIVSAAHPQTPLILSPSLSQRVGKEVHLKLEGTSAVRSFKFRGALVAVSNAVQEFPGRPIVTASTGNHGQGVAFAGKRLGVEIIVCSPTTTLDEKRAAMESLGAEVVVTGSTLTESEHRAREIASERGGLYIEDGESPHLMSGAATVVMEMLEQKPDLETIVVPIGGGNLVAASLLAVDSAGSSASVVGVQSVAAPGATFSWLAGEVVRHECHTFAGGLATERPGELSLAVMTRLLETAVLVTDDDLRAESGAAFRSLGLVVEGAAAAPLAAIRHHPEIASGDRIGIVVSGSWLSADQLAEGLDLDSHSGNP